MQILNVGGGPRCVGESHALFFEFARRGFIARVPAWGALSRAIGQSEWRSTLGIPGEKDGLERSRRNLDREKLNHSEARKGLPVSSIRDG